MQFSLCVRMLSSSTDSHRVESFSKQNKFTVIYKNKKLSGFGPQANYADRAAAACWRSSANSHL
jgi:hypothetical protein